MLHNLENRRVVITGVGNISALGNTWQEVKTRLLNKESAIRYMHEWEQYPELHTKLGAPIDNFELPSTYRRFIWLSNRQQCCGIGIF